MALNPRKGTFQLLEEFAIPYTAPKYTFKSATPELIESIRVTKLEENRIQAINRKVIAGLSILFSIALSMALALLNTHPMVVEYFR